MSKVAFSVQKPLTIRNQDQAKTFGKGEILHLSPDKATPFLESGYLIPYHQDEESDRVPADANSGKSPAGNILEEYEKRIKVLTRAGLSMQAASTYAAEVAISTLRRLQASSVPPGSPRQEGPLPKSKNRFNKEATAKGVGEWAEYSYNISQGCHNGCVYCYAKGMAVRFGRVDSDADWSTSTVQREKVAIHQKVDGTVMFPSTHDITPSNLDECIETLSNILQAGNRVLVVSKPSLPCIQAICERFAAYRDNVLFRFTIGTMNEEVTKLLEPNAPPPQERIACLKYAYELGFETSISSEPLLGGIQAATEIYMAVEPFVTDTIWIGKIQRSPADGYPKGVLDTLKWIKQEQIDLKIQVMYEIMKDFAKVHWKDSIKAVLDKKIAP